MAAVRTLRLPSTLWGLFFLALSLLCAYALGQALQRDLTVASVILFGDWIVSVLFLGLVGYLARRDARESAGAEVPA